VTPIFPKAPHPRLPLVIIPSQTGTPSPANAYSYQQQVDDEDERSFADWAESGTSSSRGYIEIVGAGSLDPFRAYPTNIDPKLIRLSDEYCVFNCSASLVLY
jgi:hypothetical protein